MRCYICDHSETMPSDYNQEESLKRNKVYFDKVINKPICETCAQVGLESLTDFGLQEEVDTEK